MKNNVSLLYELVRQTFILILEEKNGNDQNSSFQNILYIKIKSIWVVIKNVE